MKVVILMFIFYACSYANFLDPLYIYQAQKQYDKHKLIRAFDIYSKIDNKTDNIYYNMANILYRQKKYTQAIEYYKKINSQKLMARKLSNIANCYIGLNQIKRAISFYEESLKFEKLNHTIKNLQTAHKIQEEEKKKELNKNKGYRGEAPEEFGDDNSSNNIYKKHEIKLLNINKNNISKLNQSRETETIEIAKQKDNNITKKILDDKIDFSDNEESKYNKILEKRKLHTLLMPLGLKKEKHENNW